MTTQSSQDQDILPQLIGDFRPVDVWQDHINQVFYGLYSSRLRDYYQTFASADYRLGYALAEDYYRRLCEREQGPQVEPNEKAGNKVEKNRSTTQGSPLTVMEWGCGNGNLAACFLDRFKELDKEGSFYPNVQYILVDKVESVLAEAKQNEDLTKHQDRVKALCADVGSLDTVDNGTVDRIICNELLSELPTKLLLRRDNQLMEEHIRPNVSETKLAEIADWPGFVEAFDQKDTETLKGLPRFLEELVWEREYHKVESKELPFRRTITEFLKGIDEEILVPVNIGAYAALKEAKRVLSANAIGFSSFDAGTADRHLLNDPEKPCYSMNGGQFSFMINLALMEEIAAHLEMVAVDIEPQKEYVGRSLKTNVMNLMDLLASHPHIPNHDSWEFDAFILRTLQAMNEIYRSPYQRTIEFPLRETTPSTERKKLEEVLHSFKKEGVPDTIAYLTEDEVWGAMRDLEPLGYDREGIRAALTAPPQPVDYFHFSFSSFCSK